MSCPSCKYDPYKKNKEARELGPYYSAFTAYRQVGAKDRERIVIHVCPKCKHVFGEG